MHAHFCLAFVFFLDCGVGILREKKLLVASIVVVFGESGKLVLATKWDSRREDGTG